MSDADAIGPTLARVVEVLRRHHVDDFAFTGGVAVGVWSTPRQTKDVDVCGTLPADEVDRLLALRDGVRSGAGRLPDVVRFSIGTWDVDLFVSKSEYDRTCLRRAVSVTIGGHDVRVVAVEDLLIHKLIKLRTDRRRMLQDLADIKAILEAHESAIDWMYLSTWIEESEVSLLRSISQSTDEDIARRILAL